MARHDQKPRYEKIPFVCEECKFGACANCVDVLRMVYSDITICQCKRSGHSGDPTDNQIVDPFTGSVHAPGLTVSRDGKVEFDG